MHFKKASVSNQLLPEKGNILHNEFPTKIVLLILALHSICNLKKSVLQVLYQEAG